MCRVSVTQVRGLVEEVAPGIFTFDMLSHALCDQLLAEAEHYEASGVEHPAGSLLAPQLWDTPLALPFSHRATGLPAQLDEQLRADPQPDR